MNAFSFWQEHSARWIPWLADDKYLEGFSRVLQIWKCLIKFVIWLLAGKLNLFKKTLTHPLN
jgi:hypothetical protein